MKKFTFIVEPFGDEVVSMGGIEKEAHAKAFKSLEGDLQDRCECLDCVDEEDVE